MATIDIDVTKPSREMDIAVALEIMNWQEITERPEEWGGTLATMFTLIGGDPAIQERGPWYFPPDTDPLTTIGGCTVPHYSETIAAAWLVVEEMRKRGWTIHLSDNRNHYEAAWDCRFFRRENPGHKDRAIHIGETPALAICVAALRALEVIE